MGILKSLVSGILAGYPGIQQKFTKIQDNHFKPFFWQFWRVETVYRLVFFFLENVNVMRFAIFYRLRFYQFQ